jgi:hypothetical protein
MAKEKNSTRPVELEVLVEEPSMKKLLDLVLPGWLGSTVIVRVRAFQGKSDLLKNLPSRLAGYATTLRRAPRTRVLVVVDRDNDKCLDLKQTIETMATKAGLAVRGSGRAPVVLVRIVVRELENWYFGDWKAVRAAFPKVKGDPPGRYRANADVAHSKTWEALRSQLAKAGVHVDSKVKCAECIAPFLDPDRNSSASFQTFLQGTRELCELTNSSGRRAGRQV